jgi:hypothetical protein
MNRGSRTVRNRLTHFLWPALPLPFLLQLPQLFSLPPLADLGISAGHKDRKTRDELPRGRHWGNGVGVDVADTG